MAEPDRDDGPFIGYWRRALGLPAVVDPLAATAAVQRVAVWLGWSLARAPVADSVAANDTEAAEAAFRRLALVRQTATITALRDRGLSILAIKGFDAARLYDPPWNRVLGDLDLLAKPGDAKALVHELHSLGFTVEPSPQGALGVTSDVSFHPMVSPDGLVSVDIHTALDAFPLSQALPAAAVFAEAVDGPAGLRLATHHAAVAALSNMAKERFGPYSVRHLIDLGRLALRQPVDWREVDRIVRAAGLDPARATALGALRRFGIPAERLPAAVDPAFGPAVRLARSLGRLRLAAPDRLDKIVREWGWCYSPGAVVRVWRFRLAGLLRPRSGMPPGSGTEPA